MVAPAKRTRSFARPHALALLVGGAGVVAMLVLASMISNGSTSRSVAENARSLHWANSLLGSTALSRAANAQAVVFTVDHDLGVASNAAREAALDEARAAFEYLDRTMSLQPMDAVDVDPSLKPAIEEFLEIDRQVLIDLESGNIDEAVGLSQGAFEVAYRNVEQILTEEQTRILQTIEDTETAIGRVASIASIAVTLLIPGTAITIYFLFARRQMRERRVAMECQLEAARELAKSKDDFIAGLSHELRTPLTSIYGFSELLLTSGVVDPRQAKELITIINSESSELMRMVEDLLTGARLDAGALTFDITTVDLVAEVEAVIGPFLRAGVDISVACTPVSVTADPVRLRHVLRNLVSNAQRHGGSRIAIVTQMMGDGLMLAVVDDGPGVPAEIADRLFERFVNDSHRSLLAGSVGLGLAIARTLTESMDGSLDYERNGGLTVFTVTLPIASNELPAPDENEFRNPPRSPLGPVLQTSKAGRH